MPRIHVNLIDSKFGLSFIDVSQLWGRDDETILNVIASDVAALETVSLEVARDEIMRELARFLPWLRDDAVESVFWQPHLEKPLFTNDVGVWHFRPDPPTELANMFLAGDYCRSHVDLTSMEGAYVSGLLAAECVRAAHGRGGPIEVIEPKVYPQWLMTLAKFALLPVAALAKVRLTLSPSD